jgi:hypothetical protein
MISIEKREQKEAEWYERQSRAVAQSRAELSYREIVDQEHSAVVYMLGNAEGEAEVRRSETAG